MARRQCTGTGRFCDDFGRKLEVLSALVTKQRFAATDGSKNPRRAMGLVRGCTRHSATNSDQGHLEPLISVQRNPTKSAGSGARPKAQPLPTQS